VSSIALRTYLRYLVPLTLLSALVMSPWVNAALTSDMPKTAEQARALIALAWKCGATAWIAQLLLVAAAAPAARSLVAGPALSQSRALVRGVAAMLRALVPVALAVAAIAIGALALVLPALALLVLLSLTGASPDGAPSQRLRDSIASVRTRVVPVAAVVLAMVAFDVALVLLAKRFTTTPLPKKPTPAELATYRHLLDIVVIGIVIASPIAASALAALRAQRELRPSVT